MPAWMTAAAQQTANSAPAAAATAAAAAAAPLAAPTAAAATNSAAPANPDESYATRVIAFGHGYSRETLLDAAEVGHIKDDIKTECERVGGKVLAAELPTPTS
eukprot:SAG22_NODE_17155_length_310_cov_1.222749_1_plen_102_part_11